MCAARSVAFILARRATRVFLYMWVILCSQRNKRSRFVEFYPTTVSRALFDILTTRAPSLVGLVTVGG